MNSKVLTGLTVVLGGLSLAWASLWNVSPAQATTATPTPTPAAMLVFSEYSDDHKGVLTFTIRLDGTATLGQSQTQDGKSNTFWHHDGKLSTEQFAQVKTLAPLLAGLIDQYQPDPAGKDYEFAVTEASGKTQKVNLSRRFQAYDKKSVAMLQDAAASLTSIRKPFENLLIFEWTGGFAAQSIVLTIQNDGTAIFEDRFRKTSSLQKFNGEQMLSLQALVAKASYIKYKSPPMVCADCWVYTVKAMTYQGLYTLSISDAELSFSQSTTPIEIKQLIRALRDLYK